MRLHARWSELPEELLEKIARSIKIEIDVEHFRAVCVSWRNAVPPFQKSPTLPLKLPMFIYGDNLGAVPVKEDPHIILSESTVYLIQSPSNSLAPSSSNDARHGWLVRVRQNERGRLEILSPLSERLIKNVNLADHLLKTIIASEFCITQICKAYKLEAVNHWCPGFAKVVLSEDSIWNNCNDYAIMALDVRFNIWYLKRGDANWIRHLGEKVFLDVINFKGKFYAVDRFGETITFDSVFAATCVSNSVNGGSKKKLVESSGRLYLVDTILQSDKREPRNSSRIQYNFRRMRGGTRFYGAVEINIYVLDEEQHSWKQVSSFGDRIFFVGDECSFSISAKDVGGCKGNVIFYADNSMMLRFLDSGSDTSKFNWDANREVYVLNDYNTCMEMIGAHLAGAWNDELKGLIHHNIGFYDLDSSSEPKFGSLLLFREFAYIFWPPPAWLKGN